MKDNFQHIGLARLCGWFGMSRQAYYQHTWCGISTSIEEELIIKQVQKIRLNHRKLGGRKLYELLQPFLLEHSIENRTRWPLFNTCSQLSANKKKKKKDTNN